MQGFPTGVITFLFIDREGSMKPWEDYPYEMKSALARQDSILKSAIENDHGKTIKTTGDDLHAAFPSASGAINAVLAAQLELMSEPWGEAGSLRMRTAFHSAEAESRDGELYVSVINRSIKIKGKSSSQTISQANNPIF